MEERKIERDENGRLLPGSTANPHGRPKGSYSVVEMIRRKLKETPQGKDKTYGEYFVEKIIKKITIDDDVSMMRDVIDRIDGKPKESVEHSGEVAITPIYGGRAVSEHDGDKEGIQS